MMFDLSPRLVQVSRPLAMKKEGIQTRKRKPKTGSSAPSDKSASKSESIKQINQLTIQLLLH